jgi:hypothetical protein
VRQHQPFQHRQQKARTDAAGRASTSARDLEHFVTHFGFSPNAALQAATR